MSGCARHFGCGDSGRCAKLLRLVEVEHVPSVLIFSRVDLHGVSILALAVGPTTASRRYNV